MDKNADRSRSGARRTSMAISMAAVIGIPVGVFLHASAVPFGLVLFGWFVALAGALVVPGLLLSSGDASLSSDRVRLRGGCGGSDRGCRPRCSPERYRSLVADFPVRDRVRRSRSDVADRHGALHASETRSSASPGKGKA